VPGRWPPRDCRPLADRWTPPRPSRAMPTVQRRMVHRDVGVTGDEGPRPWPAPCTAPRRSWGGRGLEAIPLCKHRPAAGQSESPATPIQYKGTSFRALDLASVSLAAPTRGQRGGRRSLYPHLLKGQPAVTTTPAQTQRPRRLRGGAGAGARTWRHRTPALWREVSELGCARAPGVPGR
jgi:hypothetical protein